MKIYKLAQDLTQYTTFDFSDGLIPLYQGRNTHNKSSRYWSTDKEWARQFTQSGQDHEIASIRINPAGIFSDTPLPRATRPDELDRTVERAKEKGLDAIFVDEGPNEPHSVLIFGAIAKPMRQDEVDRWWKIWNKK